MSKSSVEPVNAANSGAEASSATTSTTTMPDVDLRDPVVAGILAWAIPGAGHWYQGRRTKAVLFFVCIVGTFFYGLWLGGGRVVYASWGETPDEKRLPYVCQIGAGVMAMPAIWQARRYGDENFVRAMQTKERNGGRTFTEWFMAPPILAMQLPTGREMDELDYLNYTLNRRFELGTIYTMIAGLLNVLIIFDAIGGPAYGTMMAKRMSEREAGGKETAPVKSSTTTSATAPS